MYVIPRDEDVARIMQDMIEVFENCRDFGLRKNDDTERLSVCYEFGYQARKNFQYLAHLNPRSAKQLCKDMQNRIALYWKKQARKPREDKNK